MLPQKAKNETQKQPFPLGKIMLQIHFWGLCKVFRLIHLEHGLAHHSAMAPKIYKKDGRPSACTFLTPQKAANDSLQQDIPLKWSIKSSPWPPWPMFFSCAPLERSSVNKRYLLTWAFASDSPTKWCPTFGFMADISVATVVLSQQTSLYREISTINHSLGLICKP